MSPVARELAALEDALLLQHLHRVVGLARGDTVILKENDSNDSQITV